MDDFELGMLAGALCIVLVLAILHALFPPNRRE